MTESYLHREQQSVGWWAHLLMVIIAASALATAMGLIPSGQGEIPAVVIPLGIVAFVYLVFTPMTVEIDRDELRVTFGRLGRPRWSFELEEIEDPRVVQFSPLWDYGGWGIRVRGHSTCLNQRGNCGVRFTYHGRDYVIGSDDPGRLMAALRAVRGSRA